MSGYYEGHGWKLGNVKIGSLRKALQSGEYQKKVCTTVKELAEHNDVCAKCKYFKYCYGGCRTIELVLIGDKLGVDQFNCVFYEQEYYQKVKRAMGDWQNLSGMGKNGQK